ncbi:MAG: stage II sporulation protein P [Firmicutes bacterium]|nr:stage II sporulation protein P [Bacillota bacterium]
MYYEGYYNYRRNRSRRFFLPLAGLILLLLVLYKLTGYMAAVVTREPGDKGLLHVVSAWSQKDPAGILRAGLPLMALAGEGEGSHRWASPSDLAGPLVAMFTVDRQQPIQMLQSQMPLLAEEQPPQEESVAVTVPESVQEQEPDTVFRPGEGDEAPAEPVLLSDDCLVIIYFTHTGETYALTDGVERLHGKKGGVVKVGEALQKELEQKHGIKVALSDAVNDANYGTSYSESQETLRQLLEQNPSAQVVLDIHRDAGRSRNSSLVTVDGREVAPVLMVVGSDARAPFPTWRQNYDFARELVSEIEKQYRGLCLGVRIKEGRYNQFMHPRAVLLEVGSVKNSTEEAVRTGRLLAGPVAEMVKRSLDREREEEGY